jgi:integrase
MKRTFGTVDQLPSGAWRARYRVKGRQVTIPGSFATRKLANAALAEVQRDQGHGITIDPTAGKETFRSFAERHVASRTDWKETTRQDRRSLLRLHILPTFGRLALRDVTPSLIRSWHSGLHRDHPATAQAAYRLLRSILNAAIDDGLLSVNPCRVKGAGLDRAPERRIASVHELEAIADAMPKRMRSLILLAGYVGLRRSELLGLQHRDIDLLHGTVSVSRSVHWLRDGKGMVVAEPKTAAGHRTVAIPSSILEDLNDHLSRFVGKDRRAWVFTGSEGGPLLPHVLGRYFRRARASIGRDDLVLHDLRHSALTLAAVSGASVAELMHRAGHASPVAALRYQHATAERDKVIAEALAQLRPSATITPIRAARRN